MVETGVPGRDSLWTLAAVAALVGLLATLALPETVARYRGLPVIAVLVGVTVGVLSTRGTGDTAVAAAAAELCRSLAVFVLLGVWMVLFGGEDAGFLPFYVLFGGVFAVLVALVSAAIAAVIGVATSLGARIVPG
jgi:hypothetical protein